MRPAAVLLAALALSLSLAGCSGGGGGDGPFTNTCPQWVKGLSTVTFKEAFANSSVPDQKFNPETPTGAGLRTFEGHPLDFVELDFHPRAEGNGTRPQAVGVANATVELRAFRSDNNKGIAEQLLIQGEATGESKDTWTWGPGLYANFTLKVPLADPHAAPRTDPIVLRWDFMPDQNPRSPSEAVMFYTAYFWYRTCNSDGSTATA